ncbi:MAG: cobyric acid synthase [Verrucomicrobiota bacterium]|nr:cobyric acid synthase [Verrucomicrobiota bacterium]
MLQGTTSNAGKSVLASAFCRIMLQDGLRVAPFKAQNMSLNSFVTRDGGEIGRAQVVQAEACRLDPDALMNPVLLKPNTDTGSQVIVMGNPVANMNARAYTRFKASLREIIRDAYDRLAGNQDAMVLEGAGSPAEVNLKTRDLVNMAMARHAHAAVLLAGDIDRGGVYAHFVGTFDCLDPWERRLLKGYVVNRFRGDARLLDDAHKFMLRRTRRPVVGVVPFLKDLNLPEEDSVSFKAGDNDTRSRRRDSVEIVVLDLPHISNFTDFDALRVEPDVTLRIVRNASSLGRPDAVIIPGSKNVPGDLQFIRATGLADALLRLWARGRTRVVGICGGFQMMGESIADPHRMESDAGGSFDGLGLLPVRTTLEREKHLSLTMATHCASRAEVRGYEIHHGRTTVGSGAVSLMKTSKREPAAVGGKNERRWGTYLHGVFDSDAFRRVFVDELRRDRGFRPLRAIQARYDIEPALDRLADAVRSAVDMKRIYRWMGL